MLLLLNFGFDMLLKFALVALSMLIDIDFDFNLVDASTYYCLYFFNLKQNFYVCGRYKKSTTWRVLKISRQEPSELNIIEDSAIYSDFEYSELINRIHEGNKSTGGLKIVAKCFGIVGMLYLLQDIIC